MSLSLCILFTETFQQCAVSIRRGSLFHLHRYSSSICCVTASTSISDLWWTPTFRSTLQEHWLTSRFGLSITSRGGNSKLLNDVTVRVLPSLLVVVCQKQNYSDESFPAQLQRKAVECLLWLRMIRLGICLAFLNCQILQSCFLTEESPSLSNKSLTVYTNEWPRTCTRPVLRMAGCKTWVWKLTERPVIPSSKGDRYSHRKMLRVVTISV